MPAVGSGNSLTYTEVHAVVLGLVAGALAAYATTIGYRTLGVGFGALVVGLALGFDVRGRTSAAQRTLAREPWYALSAFALAGTVVLSLW